MTGSDTGTLLHRSHSISVSLNLHPCLSGPQSTYELSDSYYNGHYYFFLFHSVLTIPYWPSTPLPLILPFTKSPRPLKLLLLFTTFTYFSSFWLWETERSGDQNFLNESDRSWVSVPVQIFQPCKVRNRPEWRWSLFWLQENNFFTGRL